ncbi:MAG: hypothetical protein KAY16_03925 [Spirochaetes bacterium]|nr:hypothetical protein [Spirochaetota bacterium]
MCWATRHSERSTCTERSRSEQSRRFMWLSSCAKGGGSHRFVNECHPEPCPELGSESNVAYLDSGTSPE